MHTRHGGRLVGVGRRLRPVQNQGPLLEDARLVVVLQAQDGLHDDVQGPGAAGHLRPRVGGHEGPAGEAVLVVVVVGTLAEDHGAEGGREKEIEKTKHKRNKKKTFGFGFVLPETEREGGGRERDRQTQTERKRETETERQRETERDRQRQTDRQTDRDRENSNTKTLIPKDSSVRSIWTYLTASPCYTTHTNKHDYTTREADRQTSRQADRQAGRQAGRQTDRKKEKIEIINFKMRRFKLLTLIRDTQFRWNRREWR